MPLRRLQAAIGEWSLIHRFTITWECRRPCLQPQQRQCIMIAIMLYMHDVHVSRRHKIKVAVPRSTSVQAKLKHTESAKSCSNGMHHAHHA